MNIPTPPLYNSPAPVGPGQGADAADGTTIDQGAYHGYYGGQNSSSDDAASEAAHHFSKEAPAPQQQQSSQQQNLGEQYYAYYRSSQTMHDDPQDYDQGHISRTAEGGHLKSPSVTDQEISNRTYDADSAHAIPHSIPQAQEQYSYYGKNKRDDQQYPTQQQREADDQQYEEKYNDTSYDQSFEQEAFHREPFHDEFDEDEKQQAAQSSFSLKEGILPSVIALAQKFLPTVLKRLDQHESMRIDYSDYQYDDDDDDFAGRISPIGSPTSPMKPTLNYPAYNYTSPEPKKNATNLKTTGLDENDYQHNTSYDQSIQGEGEVPLDDPEMGTPLNSGTGEEYLPQSAALLVSALQGSARKIKHYSDADISSKLSFDHLPSLMDEIVTPLREDNADQNLTAGIARSQPTKRLGNLEKEAEALLESICKDERGRVIRHGSSRRSSNSSQDDTPGSAMDGGASFEEDEGSIGGDMARLTRSISVIQRDLENVDFSHLDDVYQDGFEGVGSLDNYDGDGGLLARLKMWLSRGSIMEQKLLNTYMNPMEGDHDGTATENSGGRYADNPVLVWSLALMWAFVVLILMHPKIAELVEGGDPGQLADIVEWLFG